MSASKNRAPKLGRGLSSLMATPVKVEPPPAPDKTEADQDSSPNESGSSKGQAESASAIADRPSKPPMAVAPKGRGYSPDNPAVDKGETDREAEGDGSQPDLVYLPVNALQPNRHQPRQRFDEAGLERLAESIRREGIMQPIVVRPIDPAPTGAGRYEVVAGERRWRAAQLAGLSRVPALVRDLNDRQIAEWALIENLQREDLNPIERAEAFARLIDQFGLSHEEAGQRVGLDRSSITNHLRLLSLCDGVKQMIRENLLSMGQARALAGLSDDAQQLLLAERVVRQGMSVREVEQAVRRLSSGADGNLPSSPGRNAPYLADLEKQISQQLGTKVSLRPGRKKGTGKLSIEFYSLDQFDALLARMGVKTD